MVSKEISNATQCAFTSVNIYRFQVTNYSFCGSMGPRSEIQSSSNPRLDKCQACLHSQNNH